MESGSPKAEIIFHENDNEEDGLRINSFSKQPQKFVYIVPIAELNALKGNWVSPNFLVSIMNIQFSISPGTKHLDLISPKKKDRADMYYSSGN